MGNNGERMKRVGKAGKDFVDISDIF